MKVIAAIDIGGTGIKFGILTPQGEILKKHKRESQSHLGGKVLMENAVLGLSEILADFDMNDVIGIGIGTAGQVDHKKGVISFASEIIPGYTGTDVKGIFEKKFNKPVFVENDVNTAILGEMWKGAGAGNDIVLGITVGTGIGGAIILNGEVFHGATGSAGEFGHAVIQRDGPSCTCGGNGCWELYGSSTALIRFTRELLKDNKDSLMWKKYIKTLDDVNAKNIFDAAKEGDELMLSCVEKFSENIAAGLVSLVHTFNPQVIIIGGGVSNEGAYLIDKIDRYVRERAMPSYLKCLSIKAAALGNDAGITGACKLVINGLGL
ncbi:MAG: ROK family protein [Clostridia bacterium]|nr:ROK family protein [Clostridia bacterium]